MASSETPRTPSRGSKWSFRRFSVKQVGYSGTVLLPPFLRARAPRLAAFTQPTFSWAHVPPRAH